MAQVRTIVYLESCSSIGITISFKMCIFLNSAILGRWDM